MSQRISRSLLAALLLVASAARAESGTGRASFVAHGPAGMKIEGATSEVAVSSDADWLSVSVRLAALQTGIELRDKHLRDDLEVAKYPVALLRVRRSLLAATAGAGRTCAGELTLHGQTRPVSFEYRATASGAGVDVEGTLRLDTRDFGIVIPAYLGLRVQPEVETRASLHLSP